MRVLITGGQGLVGTPITERFVELGWDVRVISIEPDCAIEGIEYAQCDIMDAPALAELVAGRDAIVHLAAIASTRTHPNETIFEINVAGTYNVFEAASKAGVKRIAQASSINAIGGFWGCDDRLYDYFPIDEDLPLFTTDAYSFSKQLVEDIADYYWRRAGISSVSFRLPAVLSPEHIEERQLRQGWAERRRQVEAFIELPAAERAERLREANAVALKWRADKIMEYDGIARDRALKEGPSDDWLAAACFYDRFNFWTFIHTADSTQAFERAITADYQDAHPLFVNSDLNSIGLETETLLALFYPEVERRVRPIRGCESPVSIERARQLLGFEPTARSL